MYTCIKCGALKKNGEEACRCGSSIFVWSDQRSGKKKDEEVYFLNNLETIKIRRKGVYLIDLDLMMKNGDIIVKDDQGVYYVYLPVETKLADILKSPAGDSADEKEE